MYLSLSDNLCVAGIDSGSFVLIIVSNYIISNNLKVDKYFCSNNSYLLANRKATLCLGNTGKLF